MDGDHRLRSGLTVHFRPLVVLQGAYTQPGIVSTLVRSSGGALDLLLTFHVSTCAPPL